MEVTDNYMNYIVINGLITFPFAEMHKLNSYLGECDEGQRGHSSEHDSRDQHDQSNQNIIAEVRDGRQPTAGKDKDDWHIFIF